MAIFSVLENMEGQLRGLKALIGMSNHATDPAVTHKVTKTNQVDPSSHLASEEDEAALDKMMEEQRIETERLSSQAAEMHKQIYAEVIDETNGAQLAE